MRKACTKNFDHAHFNETTLTLFPKQPQKSMELEIFNL